MIELVSLQSEVGKWAEETFPQATDESVLAHLREELGELGSAVHGRGDVAEEAADVLLILLHLCHRKDVDLGQAAARKFAACRQREWADDGRGYVRHVEEVSP